MAAIKYSPYIPNVEAWIDYFKNQPKEYKKFYTIGRPKQRGEDMDPIKMVSPTEQVVEQAKSRMKRAREDDVETQSCRRRKTDNKQKKKKTSGKHVVARSSKKSKK